MTLRGDTHARMKRQVTWMYLVGDAAASTVSDTSHRITEASDEADNSKDGWLLLKAQSQTQCEWPDSSINVLFRFLQAMAFG